MLLKITSSCRFFFLSTQNVITSVGNSPLVQKYCHNEYPLSYIQRIIPFSAASNSNAQKSDMIMLIPLSLNQNLLFVVFYLRTISFLIREGQNRLLMLDLNLIMQPYLSIYCSSNYRSVRVWHTMSNKKWAFLK